ncbi:flavin reductase family protein [Geobacillus sp. G4]|nr:MULTISPECIES: flavin reductase family protein [Geobacillus]KDE46134.1 flavin reductase [Geobacillus sp. CAMR12739]BAC66054.1 flavin reductase [Bacillus sp. DSM 411]AMV12170.1 flavin reductase [Geobacillus thermoleovorans]AOL35689.1 flavin reductase [Geobacillus thermoleovorans]AUI37298.1 flavin reductase [[Bacillus] caldolyticus]
MDDRTFRRAMGKFATGVTVVTTEFQGEAKGMTANAFMSVSLDPKLVVVSIGHKARMHDIVKQTGKFAVNILRRDQEELSRLFAGQLKEERHVSFDWVNGHPILPEALANILCNVHSTYVAGDHTLYFGEVTDILMKDEPGDPLLFFEGKYRSIGQ